MIIEYDERGQITHIVNDPVPPGLTEALAGNGTAFLSLPPVPWPPELQFDENGNAVLDEDGNQVMDSNGMDFAEVDIEADYVTNGEVRRRPTCPGSVAVAGRTVTISGSPDGATISVEIDGEVIDIAEAAFEVDEPGPLTVIIAGPWPYLEARHDVDVE